MNCRQIMKRKSAHARHRAWWHNVGDPLVAKICEDIMMRFGKIFVAPDRMLPEGSMPDPSQSNWRALRDVQ